MVNNRSLSVNKTDGTIFYNPAEKFCEGLVRELNEVRTNPVKYSEKIKAHMKFIKNEGNQGKNMELNSN